MKSYTTIIWIVFLFIGASTEAQITFNACNSIIENQDYTFNFKSADATGRNVFETDPVTGDQNCGGIGVCEMQVAWSVANNRWEIFADDGNGTFGTTYVLYYNTEASMPNPPSLLLGTWEENTVVTASLCMDGITTLSGDVQDTTLGLPENPLEDQLVIFPNPASNVLNIKAYGILMNTVTISDMNGRIIMNDFDDFERLDVSRMSNGIYFLKIETADSWITKKIVIE